jgi:PAS domain S-box-containing protein
LGSASASERPPDVAIGVLGGSRKASLASVAHATAFDAAPCGIIVADGHGRIVDVNPRALRDLGYERDDLLGAVIETLIPEESRAAHTAARAGFCPGPRHAMGQGRDLAARRKDGTTFPAEIALSRGDDGRFVVFIVDLTERRRTDDALATSEARLRASDKLASLGMLAAGVAHEVSNPLQVILGNLELLAPSADDESKRVAYEDVCDAAERIRAVVSEMKALSRRDDEGTLAPFDVRRAVEASLRMTKHETFHRAKVVQDLGEVPAVDGNESRLVQVLVNLLVNAAHAIPIGRPRENEIRIRTRVGPGPSAVVEISDSGCGMSTEVQRRVFEPFFTTKPIGHGTGLGLAICERIVKEFGGTLQIESAVGKGTLVRVALPARR